MDEAKVVLKEFKNMKEFYAQGLQEFEFKHKYDCIWIQWVSSHLTDEDLIAFLQKCGKNLTDTVYSRVYLIDRESLC